LTRLRTCRQNRRSSSAQTHSRTSRNAVIVVYVPKGTTSKETMETRSSGKWCFCGQIARTFG
jgi:hypothetical protein